MRTPRALAAALACCLAVGLDWQAEVMPSGATTVAPPPRVLVGIMTAPGPKYRPRRDAVWASWANVAVLHPHLSSQVRTMFLVGHGPEVPTLPAEPHFDEATHTLTLPLRDGYNQVIIKYLHFARWAVSQPDAPFDFLVKADDDTFVRLPQLVATLSRISRRNVYYGMFCTGEATRMLGHKNFVPTACFPLASYPPYAHGSLYAVSWDVVLFLSRNADDFARTTINECIVRECSSARMDCRNPRGQMPSLEDVQVALWLLPLGTQAVHDHRLGDFANCHTMSVAVWDISPEVIRALGAHDRARPADHLCIPTLFEFSANHSRDNTLVNTFGDPSRPNHQFPLNHQVYQLYFHHALENLRAERYPEAIRAFEWGRALSPASSQVAALSGVATYLQRELAKDGCAGCAAYLRNPLEQMLVRDNRGVTVCSSVSGNFESVKPELMLLVEHLASRF